MVEIRRRTLLAAGVASAAVGLRGLARAAAPLELEWSDLVPEHARGQAYEELRGAFGLVEHGQLSTGFEQEIDASITTEFDGREVRLPGFMVPLDYEGMGVTVFLLVPYVGACIHVPPPPPNQIIFVRAAAPYEVVGYFEPIIVTGELNAMAKATELAEIGYSIDDARVEPYE